MTSHGEAARCIGQHGQQPVFQASLRRVAPGFSLQQCSSMSPCPSFFLPRLPLHPHNTRLNLPIH